ncbi:hypothetical protein M9Y10_035641 [Tritrichomonas musculus]|uniref:Uncharacterized protein n=1 Tax=Tritrichomonas musculus TaxID=1915356 RepID=A0ABR2GX64_9EUKA
MNKNKQTMINLISYIIIFPQLPENEIKDFIVYIDNLNKIKAKETHPIFHWIVNGLISAIELKEPNQSVIPFIKSIVDFASRVYTKSILRRTIKYPCLPLPIHIIIPWLMSLTDTWLQVQLQFIDKMKRTKVINRFL